MTRKEISRQELYELVWSKPLTKLSREFGVSDSFLGRICRELKVPLPGMGYWRKVECGTAEKRPPLPEPDPGTEIYFRVSSTERFKLKDEGAPMIPIPEKLGEPHPLITKTMQLLKKTPYGYLHPTEGPEYPLNIRVSVESMPRALLIVDAFIKALYERGYSVKTTNHDSYAVVKGEELSFDLHERGDGKFVFSNKRGFWPKFRNQWRDGKRSKVEQHLGKIIVEMERLADYWVEEHRKETEQRLRWEAIQKQRQVEQSRVTRAEQEVGLWMEARRLRSYVRAMRASARTNEKDGEWLSWCVAHANKIDPTFPKATKIHPAPGAHALTHQEEYAADQLSDEIPNQ